MDSLIIRDQDQGTATGEDLARALDTLLFADPSSKLDMKASVGCNIK